LSEQADQLTPEKKSTVQSQLAYAYRQVGDGQKAERYYREALANNTSENPQQTLLFAQTLAGNGKFQEAQKVFDRYEQLKEKQPARAPYTPSSTSTTSASTRKEAVKYRLEYLDFNTSGEEFSPAFYQNGLVYVAGKK